MMCELLLVVVIIYNNVDMLDVCLCEVDWVDEIVVLDLGFIDVIVVIVEGYGVCVVVYLFDDYGL